MRKKSPHTYSCVLFVLSIRSIGCTERVYPLQLIGIEIVDGELNLLEAGLKAHRYDAHDFFDNHTSYGGFENEVVTIPVLRFSGVTFKLLSASRIGKRISVNLGIEESGVGVGIAKENVQCLMRLENEKNAIESSEGLAEIIEQKGHRADGGLMSSRYVLASNFWFPEEEFKEVSIMVPCTVGNEEALFRLKFAVSSGD